MQRESLAVGQRTLNISHQGVRGDRRRCFGFCLGSGCVSSRQIGDLSVCMRGIPSLKPCLFDTAFLLRWLLPPQALNAYYLPNKNQMGECVTLHCAYWYLCSQSSVSTHRLSLPHSHSVRQRGRCISYTQLHHVAVCFQLVKHDGREEKKKKKCPPPHIIFPLIAHSLIRSPPHILNTPLEEKQAETPSLVLTNLALRCHPFHTLPLHLLPRSARCLCLPAGLNLSQKNQWRAHKPTLEDRRSQENTVIRARGIIHFNLNYFFFLSLNPATTLLRSFSFSAAFIFTLSFFSLIKLILSF